MRAPKSRFEGQTVTIMASGFDFPIEGRIEGFVREGPKSWEKYLYHITTSDKQEFYIDADDLIWIHCVKTKKPGPKVVDLSKHPRLTLVKE